MQTQRTEKTEMTKARKNTGRSKAKTEAKTEAKVEMNTFRTPVVKIVSRVQEGIREAGATPRTTPSGALKLFATRSRLAALPKP